MNNKTVYLTAEGLEKLKAELHHLVTVGAPPRVAARIHDAKLDGDISENAEYEDAKQEQSFLEGRIATLEGQLKHAEVISPGNGDKVAIGSKVVIKGTDGEESLTIVGLGRGSPARGPDQQRVPGWRRADGPQEGRRRHRPDARRTGHLHRGPRRLGHRPARCSGPMSSQRASPAPRSSTTRRLPRARSTSAACADR